MKKGWLLALVCLVSLPVKAEEVAPLEKAKAFVDTYISMNRTFDPKLADLFSDKAVIKQHQIDAKGKTTEVTLVTAKYKESLRNDFPKQVSVKDGQYIYFTDVEVKPEGDAFRATGRVNSKRWPVSRPFSLLVKQLESGGWQIIEESSTRIVQ